MTMGKSKKLLRYSFSGRFSPMEKMPAPNVQVYIRVEDNADSVGGGAAALGTDGKWYWTYNGEIAEECYYNVKSWSYL